MNWNTKLFFFINRLSGKHWVLDALGRAGAEWALFAMLGWLAVASYARYDHDSIQLITIAVSFMVVSVVGLLCSFLVAAVVREPRPYVRYPAETKLLFSSFLSWKSFPSDHSLAAFLMVGIAYCFGLPWVMPLAVLALFVWLGRIFAGVHYPSDVLAGVVLGGLVVLVYGLVGLSLVQVLAPEVLRFWHSLM
jgi:membrane-associated phospholipid phosphatase